MRLNNGYWNSLIAVSHTFSLFEFKFPPILEFKIKYYDPKAESPYLNMNIKLENMSKSIVFVKVKQILSSKNYIL